MLNTEKYGFEVSARAAKVEEMTLFQAFKAHVAKCYKRWRLYSGEADSFEDGDLLYVVGDAASCRIWSHDDGGTIEVSIGFIDAEGNDPEEMPSYEDSFVGKDHAKALASFDEVMKGFAEAVEEKMRVMRVMSDVHKAATKKG